MDEHSDLDELRPRWAWTKVSGARKSGEKNDRLLGRAGHPSTQEKPKRLRPIGNAGEDLLPPP